MGKVKTRLAKSIGDKAALNIYKKLLITTEKATSTLDVKRHIYALPSVLQHYWSTDYHTLQTGTDLGERMLNAFKNGFEEGFDKIVLIGSDLPEISEGLVTEAFKQLQVNDVVFGPSIDGGYYLIGLSTLHACIFKNKPWSTPQLLNETLTELHHKNVTVSIMQTLNDIDTFEDLKQYPDYLKFI